MLNQNGSGVMNLDKEIATLLYSRKTIKKISFILQVKFAWKYVPSHNSYIYRQLIYRQANFTTHFYWLKILTA